MHPYASACKPVGAVRGAGSAENGITDGCELLCGCWDLNPVLLARAASAPTAESLAFSFKRKDLKISNFIFISVIP